MIDTITHFLDLLNENKILYVHWKSNLNIADTLEAKTDFDILVDQKHQNSLIRIFDTIHAVKFKSENGRYYSYIEDYLALDISSKIIIHFHVHYQIEIGQKFIKNYILPFSNEILLTRIKHPEFPVWISSHEWEILLLILRIALRPGLQIKKSVSQLCRNNNWQNEFNWLANKIDFDKLDKIINKHFEYKAAFLISKIIRNGINSQNIAELHYRLKKYFRAFRKQNDVSAFLKRMLMQISLRISQYARPFNLPLSYRRTLPQKGILVVFIGCDGSGKSTLSKNVAKLFQKKEDVYKVYFGHGKSHPSIFLTFFLYLYKSTNFIAKLIRSKNHIGKILFSIGVTIDKQLKIYKTKNAIKKGFLVICDRFPQTTTPGINDGTWLNSYINTNKNSFLKRTAIWERNIYASAMNLEPDIVFKILVDPLVASKRNKDLTSIENIKLKQNVVNQIRFNKNTKVINFDNSKSGADRAVSDIASIIWETIYCHNNN